MARVSLILPLGLGSGCSAERIEALCRRLEETGNRVEVMGVCDPGRPGLPAGWVASWKSVVADRSGLASAAAVGMELARGDVVVILDPARGYSAADVARVVEPVLRHEAGLVVASRRMAQGTAAGRMPWSARLARRLVGSTAPFSGLVALDRGLVKPTESTPAGSFFVLELLFGTKSRFLDVPVETRPTWFFRGRRIGLDDIRSVKRLADRRLGNISRLGQFCLVGASGMVIDLSCYALFQWLFSGTELTAMVTPLVGGSLSLAVAGALAIAVALTWNFLLNRRLTFNDAREGSVVRQYLTYALSNTLGIGLSFSLRLILPNQFGFFHRHRLAAAVVGIVAATGITFSMARWLVFGRRPHPTLSPLRPPLPLRDGSRPEPSDECSAAPHSMSRSYSASSCEVS